MRIFAACLVLGSALAVALGAAVPVKEVRRTVPLAADGRLYIDTYKGSVEISAWDKPQVELYARIEPDEGLFREPGECVQRTEVRIDSWPDSLRVQSDYRKVKDSPEDDFFGGFFARCSNLPLVHYRIRMPRSAHLRIKDYKSRIEMNGLEGGAEVNTYQGSLDGYRLAGRLELETYRGEVRVQLSQLGRAARFETYRGEIDVRVPRDSRFDLAADIGHKGSLDSSFGPRARSVNGGGPLVRVKTFRGTIRLRAG